MMASRCAIIGISVPLIGIRVPLIGIRVPLIGIRAPCGHPPRDGVAVRHAVTVLASSGTGPNPDWFWLIVEIVMLSRRPATSAPGKGTDNRNKGTDNRNKGTDNRNKGTDIWNKVLVMQAAVGVVANPVGRRRSVHEVGRAGLSFPILLSAVMASQPLAYSAVRRAALRCGSCRPRLPRSTAKAFPLGFSYRQ